MATVNAISVALFNAAAGGYSAQIARDPAAFANAVGPILQKDIPNNTVFAEHVLANFGVLTSSPIYSQARRALEDLVATQGRAQAVITAIDFLKAQEGAANDYAPVALNFAVKVSAATSYSSINPNELDTTKLISSITGVDTDQLAINNALTAANANFASSLSQTVSVVLAQAAADKAAELAAQKLQSDALLKAASDKATAELKAANDKAAADLAAAKLASDKLLSDAAAALNAANDQAAQAAIKAVADKAAAVAAVDKTTDNSAAITTFLKLTAASLGLTGYESMSDTQLVNLIKYSDNQAIAAAVDKTSDNPAAITAFLRTTAAGMGVSGTSTMTNVQLLNAIKLTNDPEVAAAQKAIDDGLAKVAADKALADLAAVQASMDQAAADAAQEAATQKQIADAAAAKAIVDMANAVAAQKAADEKVASAIKTQTDEAAAKAASDLKAAQSRIQELLTVTGLSKGLTTENDTVLAVSGGNDAITATNLTYGSDDLVVDTSLLDLDVLTLSTADDITATPVVVGIERVNVNVSSVYGGDSGPAVLSFNADNIRNSQLNFDVTNVNSVVNGLEITKLPLGVRVYSSSKFTSVTISADDNAVVNYEGSPNSLTIDSPGTLTDVSATINGLTASTVSTDSDALVTLTASADTTLTANAADTVIVTSAGQATVVANAANTVVVKTTEEALVTANSAEKVTFESGDGIDSTSASAIDSVLSSTNSNTIEVNVSGRSTATVVDISGAANVNKVNVTGTQNVTIKVGLVGIDGLGTATTGTTTDDNLLVVSNANSGTTTLWVKSTGGDADFSQANVNAIVLGAAMGPTDDLTVANNALLVVAEDQSNDLDVIAKNSGSSLRITVQDNATSQVNGDLLGGIKLTAFTSATLTNNDANAQASVGSILAANTALTIASGTQGFIENSAIYLGTANLTVTGSGAVNLGSAVTAGAILGSSSLGAITLGLTGQDYVGTVTTGVGNDVLSISGAVRNGGASYSLTTGAGADSLTLSIAQNFTWAAGADYDTLKIVGSLDLSAKTITLSGVDEISLDANQSGAGTLTLSSTIFNTNNAFNLRGSSAVTDTLLVTGLSGADTINASAVFVDVNYAALKIIGGAGNDTITGSSTADSIEGGLGNDSLSGGNYGDTYIYNTGDVDAGETIVESDSGLGVDTILVVTTTDFRNMVESSFDNIEAVTLASGQTAKFNDSQLTNETIEVTGTNLGVETIEVYVDAGHQFNSGLVNTAANINNVFYYGSTGSESISGGAMSETITGGAGNDLLAGGGATDTYIFELAANNGVDRITFGVVNGTAIDDKLDLSINTFLGDGSPDIGIITESNTATTLTSNQANDNILILQNARYADASELNLSTMQFAASFNTDGKVVFVYAGSTTTDARVAVATISDAGFVSGAVDVAVLVGLTISEAVTGFSASNFIL